MRPCACHCDYSGACWHYLAVQRIVLQSVCQQPHKVDGAMVVAGFCCAGVRIPVRSAACVLGNVLNVQAT